MNTECADHSITTFLMNYINSPANWFIDILTKFCFRLGFRLNGSTWALIFKIMMSWQWKHMGPSCLLVFSWFMWIVAGMDRVGMDMTPHSSLYTKSLLNAIPSTSFTDAPPCHHALWLWLWRAFWCLMELRLIELWLVDITTKQIWKRASPTNKNILFLATFNFLQIKCSGVFCPS